MRIGRQDSFYNGSLVGEGDAIMGIGGITSTNSMSVMQMTSTNLKDHKSKGIENEITNVQQQIQKLSTEEELSATEKADEKKKLQKEKSSLDTKLKQHEEELLRSQKREAMLAELRKEQNPAKEADAEDEVQEAGASANTAEKENPSADGQKAPSLQPGDVISQNSDGTVILKEIMVPAENRADEAQTDPAKETKENTTAAAEKEKEDETESDSAAEFRPTAKEMHAMASADSSMQIAARQGTLVTKTDDGIAVLKGEIKLDEYRGTNTDRKQAELEKMQKQSLRESAFQFSLLNEADSSMQAAAETDSTTKVGAQANAERTFHVSGLSATLPEEQAAQQGFQVSIA